MLDAYKIAFLGLKNILIKSIITGTNAFLHLCGVKWEAHESHI
jgi:hypothetical protein